MLVLTDFQDGENSFGLISSKLLTIKIASFEPVLMLLN